MLEQAESEGMLSEEYDDRFVRWGGKVAPPCLDSRELSQVESKGVWRELLYDVDELKQWQSRADFLVCVEPKGIWRKAMLIHSPTNTVTFRGLTTDETYRPVKCSLLQSDWRIDNSMQDMPAQFVRAYLERLREYLAA